MRRANFAFSLRGEGREPGARSQEPGARSQEFSFMGQIGQPVRRYTVVPLEEPVSPTADPVVPPPPSKAPNNPAPVTKPEPEPVK